MTDYLFHDKNSDCVLTLSADSDEDAVTILEEKVKDPDNWRMEVLEE